VARPAKKYRLASRITTECRVLINASMRRFGINEAAVVEQAVREWTEKRGVTPIPEDYPEEERAVSQSLPMPPVAVAEQRAEYRAGE
jgi:hypothetical protein